MRKKIKDIKSHTYYIFNDIINVKDFDPNNIKIDKKSYKNILVYYIGYVTIEDSKYIKTNNNKVNEYFEEINKSKY